jgi:SAM-dependent methyltransferase
MDVEIEQARRYYEKVGHDDPALFLNESLHCPWCGSTDITRHLQTVDLIQRKRGEFALDLCRCCQHIFQNPRLSGTGLSYYYRDFYDGIGARKMRNGFAARPRTYRRRAIAVAAIEPNPMAWLDVGAGYGHFCETARAVFPNTVFHGTDASDGIDDGIASGRISDGFKEPLELLGASYPERYNVVSMYHYLEHTTDPKAELRYAASLLKPGGLLVIEVPNARSPMSHWLGRYWLPWLQPQHLHFVPSANLAREMISLGFQIEHCDSGDPHDPLDLTMALVLALYAHLPEGDVPWRSAPVNRTSRLVRGAAFLLASPFLAIARCMDLALLGPILRLTQRGNAYRLIARKALARGTRQ